MDKKVSRYSESVWEWEKKVQDEELLAELADLRDNDAELRDRFYKDLHFGTGGLRGIMGVGTNCMNVYTVVRVTEGVAAYMRSKGMNRVAVCYDSRRNSKKFADCAARVFAEKGIGVVIVKEMMPTPFLSYLVRIKKCDMGVMITASHNPAIYNGYKVYGSDGGQIIDETAKEIAGFIAEFPYFHFEAAEIESLNDRLEYCGDEIVSEYENYVCKDVRNDLSGLSVTYTPLNGTGYRIIPRVLRLLGVKKLYTVEEQMLPDGKFLTCPYPNPELDESLALGVALAKRSGSDILLATDPDSDRVRAAVLDNGEYKLLGGNETGVLLCNYLLEKKRGEGTLPLCPTVIKTIVTTDMIFPIVQKYGGKVIEVLTGFKYIGNQVGIMEKRGNAEDFLFGLEESCGYLTGISVRDKDAVQACALICEMAAFYKDRGESLYSVLQKLYQTYGYYENRLCSYSFNGEKGSKKMKELLNILRNVGCRAFKGVKIDSVKDYSGGVDGLPAANVLEYRLSDGGKLIVRPSGTEAKIKVYIATQGKNSGASEIKNSVDAFFSCSEEYRSIN